MSSPHLALSFVLAMLVFQMGCATIMSEKRYPVTIDNTHGPTFFSVHDRKNNVIHQGVTPQQVTLDAKSRPFWPAKYSVVFAGDESTTQRRELKASLDPWAAGNFVIGGGIGLVVDGASGAMFKLPKTVSGEIPAQFAITDTNQGAALAKAAVTPSVPVQSPVMTATAPQSSTLTR